jgi:hypothetical protein
MHAVGRHFSYTPLSRDLTPAAVADFFNGSRLAAALWRISVLTLLNEGA